MQQLGPRHSSDVQWPISHGENQQHQCHHYHRVVGSGNHLHNPLVRVRRALPQLRNTAAICPGNFDHPNRIERIHQCACCRFQPVRCERPWDPASPANDLNGHGKVNVVDIQARYRGRRHRIQSPNSPSNPAARGSAMLPFVREEGRHRRPAIFRSPFPSAGAAAEAE
jgi:hypothetical protein